jgi:hypothetical protein
VLSFDIRKQWDPDFEKYEIIAEYPGEYDKVIIYWMVLKTPSIASLVKKRDFLVLRYFIWNLKITSQVHQNPS